MKIVSKDGRIYSGITFLALVLSFVVGLTSELHAQVANHQIPTEVESQVQLLETKFNTTLAEECGTKLCAPAGCEVTRFRTLDEKQNSSLPGLDMSDEVVGPLQYKLEALRCEFAYEPTLTTEAVGTLRQRLTEKVRQAGVSLSINGRRLSVVNPILKKAQADQPAPTTPTLENVPANPWAPLMAALPNLLQIILVTTGLLLLIWGFRRIGKASAVPVQTTAVDPAAGVSGVPATSETKASGPSAFALINKQERLSEVLNASPQTAELALQPLVEKGDVEGLCRILQHFGPTPLATLAQKPEFNDLFATVHRKYSEGTSIDDNSALWNFFEKVERMVALAQLGRPEIPLTEELSFLKEISPDEFPYLLQGVKQDELLALLSFVPASLRSHFLQNSPEALVEEYAQHILQNPRISDRMVRRVAKEIREQFAFRHADIKNASPNRLTLIEQLLNTLRGSQRTRILNRLRLEQPALFDRLASEVLLDGAVVQVPEKVLNEVFLSLMPEEAAAYLSSHPDRVQILSKLKGPLAASIKNRASFDFSSQGLDFIENANPQLLKAQTAARQKLNEVMKKKSQSGEVNLRGLNESVMGAI